jgi:hypothetical protein
MEIIFNNTAGKYQLRLPESMVSDLDLVTSDGKPMEIFHENKLSLEWLYKDMELQYSEMGKLLDKSKKLRKRKLILFGSIFFLSVLAMLFNHKIASVTNYPVSVVNLLGVVALVISGWTIFQTYLLGKLLSKEGIIGNLKTIQLRETIIERFSV